MGAESSAIIKKPNFLVIGASRSGTTWLHDNLQRHPEIYIPREPWEFHFFSKYYHKGMEYYLSHFKDVAGEKAIGEVTPDYIFSTEAAARIHHQLPGIKLILTLRNPVDRLYSMYWILKDKYGENAGLSFEEKIAASPVLIEEGYFIDHLNNYLKYFPREDILILFFKELRTDPDNYLRKIYTFLNVDEEFRAPYRHKKVNRAGFRKHQSRVKSLYFIWKVFRKLRLNLPAYSIEKINSRRPPPMKKETREKLIELYRDKNKQLEELLEINLGRWNH